MSVETGSASRKMNILVIFMGTDYIVIASALSCSLGILRKRHLRFDFSFRRILMAVIGCIASVPG